MAIPSRTNVLLFRDDAEKWETHNKSNIEWYGPRPEGLSESEARMHIFNRIAVWHTVNPGDVVIEYPIRGRIFGIGTAAGIVMKNGQYN